MYSRIGNGTHYYESAHAGTRDFDNVMPIQFFAASSRSTSPEKRLWLAVILSALDDLWCEPCSRRSQELAADARRFFLSRDFESICAHLVLDAQAAREKLAPWLGGDAHR